MDFNITTPALLFSTTSLLLLAYTNRFATLAAVIRDLNEKYQATREENWLKQIANLRYRVYLIRNMQIMAVASLLSCVVSMFVLFAGGQQASQWIFAAALILMVVSLLISIRELLVSVGALDLLLKDMEHSLK